MPVHRYIEENGSAAKRLAGVTPDANLGESVTCMPLPSMNKAVYSGFETQGRCHQRSKPGVPVAPQNGLISTKNLKIKTLLQPVFKLICDHLVLCDLLRFTPTPRPPILWQKLQKKFLWFGRGGESAIKTVFQHSCCAQHLTALYVFNWYGL